MKRGIKSLGILILFILTLSFISCQGELSEVLAQIDQDVVLLVVVFMVIFCFVFFSLKKTLFKDDETISGIVAVMLALMGTYGINKSSITKYGLGGILEGIGFSSSSLALIIFVFVVAGMIYLIVKFARESLLIIGGLLLLLGFLAYEKALFMFTGAILIAIRLFVFTGKNKDKWKPKTKTP